MSIRQTPARRHETDCRLHVRQSPPQSVAKRIQRLFVTGGKNQRRQTRYAVTTQPRHSHVIKADAARTDPGVSHIQQPPAVSPGEPPINQEIHTSQERIVPAPRDRQATPAPAVQNDHVNRLQTIRIHDPMQAAATQTVSRHIRTDLGQKIDSFRNRYHTCIQTETSDPARPILHAAAQKFNIPTPQRRPVKDHSTTTTFTTPRTKWRNAGLHHPQAPTAPRTHPPTIGTTPNQPVANTNAHTHRQPFGQPDNFPKVHEGNADANGCGKITPVAHQLPATSS